MEYFCLLFYRNFSLSISSFHLSYELFWIQGESQTSDWRGKGMSGWKEQCSWPGSCFIVCLFVCLFVCFFTLRICFVIIFVSAFVTGKKERINRKSEPSRKNSEFIAKRGSWKSPTANEWGMQSFQKRRECLRPVYWTHYTHSTVILVGLLWHSSFDTDQCCPML